MPKPNGSAMDAIVLSMFSEPAAMPIQSTESPTPGGSLFGALVAAVAKGGEPEAETSTSAPDDGDTAQSDSTAKMPPPFIVREWLVQTETPPPLPKGLISGLEKFQENDHPAAPEGVVSESPELDDGEITESDETAESVGLPALQSNSRPSRAANDAPSADDEHPLPAADRQKIPLQTSNSVEASSAASVEALRIAEPAPPAAPVDPRQYFAGIGRTAPQSEASGKTGEPPRSATGHTRSESALLELQTPAHTARAGRTPTSIPPVQLPADTSSEIRSSIGSMTDEATPRASGVPKTPQTPEGPKIAQAGTPSPSAGTADPVSQFSINAQPNAAPANSESGVAPPQATNVSAATDGSADAPVRLAPSARNEQSPEMQALALHIAARSARGDSRFTIRLDPPELGRIEVNLSMNSHGHAQAVLAVEKPQTLDLLLRDAHGLERALKDAGLELGSNLSFSLKEEGRPSFAREHHQGPPGRTVEIVPSDKANALAALNAPLLEQLYGSRTARLDITV